MTHDELRDRLLDLAYGELSPADAREVEAHVEGCDACRAELARMQGTRRIMSALPQEPAPERGTPVLVAAAREEARVRPPTRRWASALRAVAIAASVAAVGMVSWRLVSIDRARTGTGEEDRGALASRSGRYAEAPPPMPVVPPAAPVPEQGAREAAAPPAVAQAAPPARAPDAAAGVARKAAPPPAVAAAPRDAAPGRDVADADAVPPPAAASALAERREESLAEAKRERAPEPLAAAPAPGAAGAPPPSRAAPPPPAAAAHPRASAKMASPEGEASLRRDRSLPAREAESAGAAADPLARYEALRAAGRLRADFRMAPGCTVEGWRRVERDPEGRVVAYAWDEERGGRRVIFEVVYAPDGAVASRRAYDAESRAPGPSDFAAPRAAAVDLDAPPRCR